jgi:glutathione S-transferase
MKLYFSPGACSQSPHIVLHELGIPHERQKVDTKAKQLDGGGSFWEINPKGYVPALQLDNGEILTEGPAITQYLADSVADNQGLLPAPGQPERYRVLEWRTYIGTEIHKSYGPLFNPNSSDEMRAAATSTLNKRLGLANARLEGKHYLVGERYTLADIYLFVVLGWAGHVGLDLTPFPNLLALRERVGARPAVQAAQRHEGLID